MLIMCKGQLESSELSLYAAKRDKPAGAAAGLGVTIADAAAVAVPVAVVFASPAAGFGFTSTRGVLRFTS